MPDVATTRTRDVTISGGGGFGSDSLGTFGGPVIFHRTRWFSVTEVDYWGKDVAVSMDLNEGWHSGASSTPSVTLRILYGGFTKSVTVNGTSYTGDASLSHLNTQYFDASGGSFNFTEVVHCVEHVNPNPYEVRTGVSFTCSATISVFFVDTVHGGTQTINASLTLTDADIAGFTSESYVGYDYAFLFTGIPVHFDNAATMAFDQPGLISTFSGINTHFGKAQLTGSGSGCTFHWDGVAADVNTGYDGGSGDTPAASIRFAPSWALSVESTIYHYADGSEVGATLDHYYGTDLVGSFASGSSYRYPASGLIDYVVLDQFLPGQNRAGGGFQPGSPVSTDGNYNSLGGLTGASYGPIGRLLQKPGDPVADDTQFRVNAIWANDYATYTASLHPTPAPTTLAPSGIAVKVLQPYQQGSIEWDATHKFGLFEVGGTSTVLTAPLGFSDTTIHVASSVGFTAGDLVDIGSPSFTITITGTGAGTLTYSGGLTIASGAPVVKHGSRWVSNSSGPSFPGVTAAWDGSPALLLISGAGIDGNALQVICTGPASVGTALRYLLKHQAYRYAHLRVRASPPATTLSANVSAGATDLPVASEAGFHTGDSVTVGGDTVTVSGLSAGHLSVSPISSGHSTGDAVTRVGASRVLFALTGSSAGTVAWLVTPPADGSWATVDLDLAKPDYKLPASTWVPASDLVVPATFFPDGIAFGILGAQVTVLPLDAGTFGFDYLEGYYKTTGSRTPLLVFPFLDGRGDLKSLGEYENPSLISPDPSDPVQVLTWVVNGVRGATLVCTSSVVDVEDLFDHFFALLDSAANDTGITVIEGIAGAVDPLSVFGPLNQGMFDFDIASGYGKHPGSGVDLVVWGQLRQFPANAVAYYGCGDLTAASGGYSEVVGFSLDWLFDGEAIATFTGDFSSSSATLADNDTGATISTGTPDDDGMVRLPAKYGVVYPYDNITGAAQWSAGPPAPPDPASYTTLGKLLNSDWLKAANVSDPEDGSGYVQFGSPLGRVEIVILDRYQTFLYLHGEAAVSGVDLTTSLVGVHIVCALAGRPVVKTTRDAGRSWDMADLLDPCDSDALPTIARDRRDVLYVWDHTTSAGTPNAVLFRSTNYGADWEHLGSRIEGIKYPRMANTLQRHFVAGHNGDTLVVYGSTAEAMGLGDWDLLSTVAAPMQLAGFRADRRGRLHLVYVDALGTIVQRVSEDGINWTDPVVAIEAASEKPAAAFALEKGLVVLWNGGTMQAQPIKANLYDPEGAPVSTALTAPEQYLGLEADRREVYWLAAQLSGASLLVAYTKDGTTWATLP